MAEFIARVLEYWHTAQGNTWTWFATLSREEWLVVLAVGALAGFLCLRGFGSRNTY